MVSLNFARRCSPIGVDLGSRSVKLIQFDADGQRLVESSRWDLPAGDAEEIAPEEQAAQWSEAISQARKGHRFRGREATICLSARELFVQNIRVPKSDDAHLDVLVRQEAASRIPFDIAQAEIRFVPATDVRQGEVTKREIILLACHRPVLERIIAVVEQAGLQPVAIDVEPACLLRCYSRQFRRDEDRQSRAMYVHMGSSNTVVVIAHGEDALFVKYIDLGGQHMNEAVSRSLKLALPEAAALRRSGGDRRVDQQDAQVARSVAEAVRPVIERLGHELFMCVRYHSVTFRGQPLVRVVLGGGEASPALAEALSQRLDLHCEVGDPLRSFNVIIPGGHHAQWDVAAGLALRKVD